jgi:uncharacterized protein
VAAFQAGLIMFLPNFFLHPLTAPLDRTTWLGWSLAILVAVLYVLYSVRGLPTVGKYLWKLSTFKLVGLAIALPAAIVEEVFFRQYVMNVLASNTLLVQIVASALSFGLAHAIWGVRGGWRAAAGAVASTTLMGAGLAVVYVASDRVVLPCVVGHFLITLILEPWLLYAYIERATNAKQAA